MCHVSSAYYSSWLWNRATIPFLSLPLMPFVREEASAKFNQKKIKKIKENLVKCIESVAYLLLFCLQNPHFLHYTTISVSESKRGHISLQPLV